jgi:hypothetical protein
MAEGDIIEWVKPSGWYTWIRWTGKKESTPVLKQRSMEILLDAKLIKPGTEDAWWGVSYIITPAGRAYLEGL